MVDYIISLFQSTATVFTSNGIGTLSESISCTVTEAVNGEYELELEYPSTGRHYEYIGLRRIIVTKPNPYATPQAFRIYSISKPINKIVTINAQHISYDLSGYIDTPFTSTSLSDAFVKIKSYSVPTGCPFTFTTNMVKTADLKIPLPVSIRSILGGDILALYGGEYEFDNYSVKLNDQRGATRGVSIRYGKNLTDLKQEENCANVYTAVYPYWFKEGQTMLTLPEKTISAVGTYDFVRVMPLDWTANWEVKPTAAVMRAASVTYMATNKIGIPSVSLSVSFALLSQAEEYKSLAILEGVKLCDFVDVEFLELGVSATARCIKTIYNVITNKYEKIELGDVKSNVASIIVDKFQSTTQKIVAVDKRFSAEVDTIKIGLADIDAALIKTATIDYLDANYIDANEIHADYAHMTNGVIDTATIDVANVENLAANYAHIVNGVIDTATIDVAKIENLSANYAHTVNGVIDNATISFGDVDDLASNYAHIVNGNIDTATIDVGKINNLSTNYAHIVNGVIDNAVIDVAKVENLDTTYAHITEGYIDAAQIDEATITNAMIDRGTANKLAIQTADILDGNITNAKIATATIEGAKIAFATIDTAQIALGAITTALIEDAAIGTVQIADGSITDLKVIGLSASKITAGTIDCGTIDVINLHAANITVGTINGVQIASETITSGNIQSGTIVAGDIKPGTITADQLMNGTITGNKIDLGAVKESHMNTSKHQLY